MSLKDLWTHVVQTIGNTRQNLRALHAAAPLIVMFRLKDKDMRRILGSAGLEKMDDFITAMIRNNCTENYKRSGGHPVFTGGEDNDHFEEILYGTSQLPPGAEKPMSGLEVLREYPGLTPEMIFATVREWYPKCPENIVKHSIETLCYQLTIMTTPGQRGYLMLSPESMREKQIFRAQYKHFTWPPQHP